MNDQNNAERHDVSIKGRGHIEITGVKEVLSFDERAVSLITFGGEMNIDGEELKIGVLDTDRGLLSVDGRVNGMYYYDGHSEEKRGILGRLFKA